jgi:hypothetical protein
MQFYGCDDTAATTYVKSGGCNIYASSADGNSLTNIININDTNVTFARPISGTTADFSGNVYGVNANLTGTLTSASILNYTPTTTTWTWRSYARSDVYGVASNIQFDQANGASYNYTGAWGQMSHRTLKKEIHDARDYTGDICKLKVRKYKFINDTTDNDYLGFVAQEVAEIFPGLTEPSYEREYEEDVDDGFDVEDGVKIPKTKKIKKTEIVPMVVKTSLFIPMLVSSIQSQQKQLDEHLETIKYHETRFRETEKQIEKLTRLVEKMIG